MIVNLLKIEVKPLWTEEVGASQGETETLRGCPGTTEGAILGCVVEHNRESTARQHALADIAHSSAVTASME
jgi:hypothetical protein